MSHHQGDRAFDITAKTTMIESSSEGDDDAASSINMMYSITSFPHYNDTQEEDYGDRRWDTSEERKISAVARSASVISFVSMSYVLFVIVRNSKLRSNLFHRLMLVMACNMAFLSLTAMWGVAAVPEEIGFYGARGNEQTCKVQGFFIQIFTYTVCNYYVSLSIYSFMAVRNDFDKTKYEWIEKWIHINVYIFPVVSAIILYVRDIFEFDGMYTCWLNFDDLENGGCADTAEDNINNINATVTTAECSTNTTDEMIRYFLGYGLFATLIIVVVVMMVAVYVVELKKGKRSSDAIGKKLYLEQARRAKARAVTRQVLLYLLAYFITFIPRLIVKTVDRMGGTVPFFFDAVASFFLHAQGLWILFAYLNLRRGVPSNATVVIRKSKPTFLKSNQTSARTNETSTEAMEAKRRESLDFQFSIPLGINNLTVAEVVEDNSSASCASDRSRDGWKESSIPRTKKQRRLSKAKRRLSKETEAAFDGFSIFDGSGTASARWRDFIYDDDSDNGEDFEESQRWEDVVQT